MVAYEFYRRQQATGDQLLGILPERRKKQERITRESVMNWVRKVLGSHADAEFHQIYFVRVEIEG